MEELRCLVMVKVLGPGWNEDGSRDLTSSFSDITRRFAVPTIVTLKIASLRKVACCLLNI
jgi:hypothetical protein